MGVKEVRFSDLSGEAADDIRTVAYSWDGRNLSVDLTAAEADALTEALRPYVEASEEVVAPAPLSPVTRRSAGTSPRRTAGANSQAGEIRAWASEYPHLVPGGKPLGERGRIGVDVIEAFDAWKREQGAPVAVADDGEVPTTRGKRSRKATVEAEAATEQGDDTAALADVVSEGETADASAFFAEPVAAE